MLEELLGVGGFGEVWKAVNPQVPDMPPVALKFCLDPEAQALLRHEASLVFSRSSSFSASLTKSCAATSRLSVQGYGFPHW